MSSSPPQEVEAKFILKDSRIGKSLLKLKTLGRFHAVGRLREKQRNIYFDTEDLRLKKAHAALKLRVVGHRAELSFKKEKSYRQGISQRIEMTVPILKKQISVLEGGHWAQLPVSRWEPVHHARAISGDKPLRKVVTLFTDRRRILFVSQKRRFEMDLDEVTLLKAGAKKFLQREVELENRTASSKQFQEVLRELRHRWGRGLESSRVSKYELALWGRQDFPRGETA